MAAPAKFLFDVDFAAGSQREPTITLSDHAAKLAEAEAAARQRGYAEGQHDAEVENGRRIASTPERIATGIDHAASALKAIEARLECEAREKIDEIARGHGFAGRLVVLGEPNIAAGDCRIEWADGGVNRDAGAADRVIGEAVARYITARRSFAEAS
jgi:flagellar assembly protein FliH